MKKTYLILIALTLFSCKKKAYKIISENELEKLSIQKTLVKKTNYSVFRVGDSTSDPYPNLLVKSNHLFLFDSDCGLESDSTILLYSPAFIIDDQGEFRKNGIWVYAEFYKGGVKFNVDSIPKNWNHKIPNDEGIYIYQNSKLVKLSKEQSEERFNEKKINGFYFIPNKGRLFNRIKIKELN